MRNEILTIAAFAYLAVLAGCSDRTSGTGIQPDGGVKFTVTIPDVITKTAGVPSGENAINDLQILVFDSKGRLETYKRGSGNTMSMTCTTGEKRIAAFVNSPGQTSVLRENELASLVTDLADNSTGGLVMAGETSVVLSASCNVNINVSRMAARVRISKIENAMALAQHRKMQFEVKAVYLVNVAGDKAFFSDSEPAVWYNKSSHDAGAPAFLYDSVQSGKVAAGGAYTGSHYFYCYPNHTATDTSDKTWCARKTRLVVEVALDGEIYYYPITLNAVEGNTTYSYELKITRPGSMSPDMPVEDAVVEVTVKVENWVDLPSVIETI